jgi:hypothetical protein
MVPTLWLLRTSWRTTHAATRIHRQRDEAKHGVELHLPLHAHIGKHTPPKKKTLRPHSKHSPYPQPAHLHPNAKSVSTFKKYTSALKCMPLQGLYMECMGYIRTVYGCIRLYMRCMACIWAVYGYICVLYQQQRRLQQQQQVQNAVTRASGRASEPVYPWSNRRSEKTTMWTAVTKTHTMVRTTRRNVDVDDGDHRRRRHCS